MKKMILLILIAISFNTLASEYNFVFSLAGTHYSNNEYYNNNNQVLGLERVSESGNSILLSTFVNSYNVRSYSLMYNAKFRKDKRVKPILSIGICKGYEAGIKSNEVRDADGHTYFMYHNEKFNHLFDDYSVIAYAGVEIELREGYSLTVLSTHHNLLVTFSVAIDWNRKVSDAE